MEEQARQKKMRKKKWRNILLTRKSKRGDNDAIDMHGDGKYDKNAKRTFHGATALYLEQYRTKKATEKKLDDEHYWSEEEDKTDIKKTLDKLVSMRG